MPPQAEQRRVSGTLYKPPLTEAKLAIGSSKCQGLAPTLSLGPLRQRYSARNRMMTAELILRMVMMVGSSAACQLQSAGDRGAHLNMATKSLGKCGCFYLRWERVNQPPPCSGQNFSTVRATVRGAPFFVKTPQQGIAW